MNTRHQIIAVLLLTIIAPLTAAAHYVKMGPILHFTEHNRAKKIWAVSALYVLEHKDQHDPLTVDTGAHTKTITGKILGSKFGFDFVRYDIHSHQQKHRRAIEYGLDERYQFFVPAITDSHQLLFHSCNGYQREKDRKRVHGINPMWRVINQRHQQNPYALQLAGGDQLYVDGIINEHGEREPHVGKTFGVFALPSLQAWIKDKEHHGSAPFTEKMRAEVDRFFFEHYVRQYNEPEFKKAMATIPSLAQPDDHDYFDGYGSYDDYLRAGAVMSGIGTIGMWYAFTVQHHLVADDYVATERTQAKPHHFMNVVDNGKIAIYGVDTRTERSRYQVVSKSEWQKIFADLKTLDRDVEHLIFMLGIPVVFAQNHAVEKAFEEAKVTPGAKTMLSKTPLLKNIFQKNAFGLFELEDDLRDHWNHPDHRAERDFMVAALQEFADERGIRVSLIGGDVHLGGFGVIRKEVHKKWQHNTTIAQIISSPVGNVTPPKLAAQEFGAKARHPKIVADTSHMYLQKLRTRDGNKKKTHALIPHRNFVTMKLTGDNDLDVEWSAERKLAPSADTSAPHTLYYKTVPRAVRSAN